ncbi:MAG: hypothetical protein HZA17_03355, partial [Nitrospirae bacterium]|nr:hypothetical protein [Nitrospirota bacterium]
FITLSVSTFVPKPFTPFQWHPMESLKEVKERLNMIKKGLSREKGVRVLHDVPKYAYLQGLFSIGSRKTAMMIEDMAAGRTAFLQQVISGREQGSYVFRKKDRAEIFPWDFIDIGISKEQLWEEYRLATGI